MQSIRVLASILFAVLLLTIGCADTADEGDETYADEMARQHEDDSTEPTAMAAEPIIPVDTQRVDYGAGVEGYMAAPARSDSVLEAMGRDPEGALPAIIVIHEWWGLNDNIRTMTRRLAGEGYRALAVDLYQGQVAQDPERARELVGQATEDEEALVENLQQAYRFLEQEHNAPEIGVIGWCFGGGMALAAAVNMPAELDAAVIYYGQVEDYDRETLESLEMPLLGIFGEEDESIPVENVRAFEETLNDLGKDVEVHVYEGAGHAFANPTGANYVEEAAQDAWDRTVTFLSEHLYGEQEDLTDTE